MIEYPKIESLYNRDEKTHRFNVGEFRRPEFEYLYNNDWVATEKVDGTNVRLGWDGERVTIAGRTDRAQMHPTLTARLLEMFPVDKFDGMDSLTLYGEGYGAKIQKGGGNYKADGVDFALFDVRCDGWWLRRVDVVDVAHKLNIQVVPIVLRCSLHRIGVLVAEGVESLWGDFPAEGVVCKPAVEMNRRDGKRVIVKIKTKDFA